MKKESIDVKIEHLDDFSFECIARTEGVAVGSKRYTAKISIIYLDQMVSEGESTPTKIYNVLTTFYLHAADKSVTKAEKSTTLDNS